MPGWRTARRAAFVVLVGVLAAACRPPAEYLTLEGATMGTYYRVTARCPDTNGEGVSAVVEDTLADVNGQMSTYQPTSELSRFNQAPLGTWLPVSPELMTVIRTAVEISELSDGAFDVTVGPLVNLWGFGPAGSITRSPSAESIAEALQRVGSRYLQMDESIPALRKERALYVDLSAIAKGYGVDRVVEALEAHGCTDQLVDVGGEIAGRGLNPSGIPWRVGIEVPDPDTFGAVQRIVPLASMALATSGDYRNFLDLEGGRRVTHTVDPRTGSPVSHTLASVTVLDRSAMRADGLATALDVLGPELGPELAERLGLAAVFLVRQADGFEERYTAAMRNYLDMQP